MRIYIWILLPEGMKSIVLSDGASIWKTAMSLQRICFCEESIWMDVSMFDERDQQA
jgi:hypothetical protein